MGTRSWNFSCDQPSSISPQCPHMGHPILRFVRLGGSIGMNDEQKGIFLYTLHLSKSPISLGPTDERAIARFKTCYSHECGVLVVILYHVASPSFVSYIVPVGTRLLLSPGVCAARDALLHILRHIRPDHFFEEAVLGIFHVRVELFYGAANANLGHLRHELAFDVAQVAIVLGDSSGFGGHLHACHQLRSIFQIYRIHVVHRFVMPLILASGDHITMVRSGLSRVLSRWTRAIFGGRSPRRLIRHDRLRSIRHIVVSPAVS
mmetsp:Transcript_29127/g.69345  ORF Transcript_29127/g.69345 Transcript_29127/m.69345 type:complete len:262 (+) Transcript_29127:49-834(+)